MKLLLSSAGVRHPDSGSGHCGLSAKTKFSGNVHRLIAAAAISLAILPIGGSTQAAFLSGQPASAVIGQPNFLSNAFGNPTATSLFKPRGVAVDPTTGKLFVADGDNNRILRYASAAALASGASAEAVLGQDLFLTNGTATTQDGLWTPFGLYCDSNGTLWVADSGNHRVLRYDSAATKLNGANANGVLGQAVFTTKGAADAANQMKAPQAVWVDANGNLWVADTGNHRVLKFPNAANLANGAAASVVLGQTAFGNDSIGNGANGMYYPSGVAVDAGGRLWVADSYNNRVMRFDNAALDSNGASADGVLGQPNLFTYTEDTGANKMYRPEGIALDGEGTLYVTDRPQCRVLVFHNAALKLNGANADRVLGQPNFSSSSSALGATGMNQPVGVFSDLAGGVWIADRENNRALHFLRVTVPTIKSSHAALRIRNGKKANVTYTIAATNTAGALRLKASPTKTKFLTFTYKLNGVNVTGAIAAGTLTTAQLAVGQSVSLTVEIKAKRLRRGAKPPKKATVLSLSASSTSGLIRSTSTTTKIKIK
jgi:sugar lactone lactonase YvrE